MWKNCASTFGVAISCIFSTLALADEAGGADAPTDVEEIIVTAQKRAERLIDVPQSISALTGEQLRAQGVTAVSELGNAVPGFTYAESVLGTPIYTIRGLGFYDLAVAVAPAVSVYVDQVPLPYSAETIGTLLDLDRVEVLKGPQGTLFGENSTGGAINYIPAKPTDKPVAGLELGYGRFDEFDSEGFVSGPVSDRITARLAVRTEQGDGWQKSETRNETLGKRDFTTARLLVDWRPREAVFFELNVNGWHNGSETQAAQFVAFSPLVNNGYPGLDAQLAIYRPAPADARIADWDPGRHYARDDNLYQLSLGGDWQMSDAVKLTSITAWSDFSNHAPSDVDGTPYDNLFFTVNGSIESFSQELRLSGETEDGRLKWIGGGNYENDATNDDQTGVFTASSSHVGPLAYHTYTDANHQIVNTSAVFAGLDYGLTNTVTAQGSIRYTRETRDFRGCVRDTGDGELAAAFSLIASSPIPAGACVTVEPPPSLAPVAIVADRLKEDNLSWKSGLSWKPTDDTLIYANVAKGYKAGSFPTVPGLTPSQFAPVHQESVLAYEIGAKADFLGSAVQIAGAAFYYDYKSKQILGYVPTAFGALPGLVSIPQSSVRGGEFTAIWRPIGALTLTAGGTYVYSAVDKSFTTQDPLGDTIDIKGEQFPNTPKWHLIGNAEYKALLSDRLRMFLGANVHYQTATAAAFGDLPNFKEPAYALVNLSVGVGSANGAWRAELWGDNVTNQFYLIHVDHTDTINRLVGEPTTYGVRLKCLF